MNTLANFVDRFIAILGLIVPIIISLSVVYFMYGLLTYIQNGGDEAKRKKATQYIIYGLIGLFVMTSFWALVYLFGSSFGISLYIPRL